MNVRESQGRASEPARLAFFLTALLVAGCGSTVRTSPARHPRAWSAVWV